MQDGSPMPAYPIVNIPLDNGGQRRYYFDPPIRKTQMEFMFDLDRVIKHITSLISYRVQLSKDFLENKHTWERHMELCESTDKLLVYWNNHLKTLNDQ